MIRRLLAWGPVAVWAAVLFLISAQHEISTPAWLPHADKVGHTALYAVLGALLARGRWRSESRLSPWIFVVLGALYGASDEFHQIFVPGRDPSFGDLGADTLGTALGYSTFYFLMRIWPAAFGRKTAESNDDFLGHDPNE